MRTFNALPALALLACSSAQAEVYEIPLSPAEPHAQVLDAGTTVCATWYGETACELAPGIYTLVTYDATWTQQRVESVTIRASGGGGASVVLVIEECPFEGHLSDVLQSCTAVCPVDSVATGGACSLSLIADDRPSAMSPGALAGTNRYRCSTSAALLTPAIGAIVEETMTASVYCLTQ